MTDETHDTQAARLADKAKRLANECVARISCQSSRSNPSKEYCYERTHPHAGRRRIVNCQQRMQNRATADWLRNQQVCPECGERGLHWVIVPNTIEQILLGIATPGFWTCQKFYGPDGRRIEGGAS